MTVNQYVRNMTDLKPYPAMAAMEIFRTCPSARPDGPGEIKFIRPDPRAMTKLDNKAISFLVAFDGIRGMDPDCGIDDCAERAKKVADGTYRDVRGDRSTNAYMNMARFYVAYSEIGLTRSLDHKEVKILLKRLFADKGEPKEKTRTVRVRIRNGDLDKGIIRAIAVPYNVSDQDVRNAVCNAVIASNGSISDTIETLLAAHPAWTFTDDKPDISINITDLR